MSIRAGHHDHFEDVLEMVNCRMMNQFFRTGKLVRVGVAGKGRGKKK